MDKTIRVFRSQSEAAAADRMFYRSLSGPERVQMALEIIWKPYGDSPPPILRELCEKFVSAKIDFIVVGAFAAIECGVPRYFLDLLSKSLNLAAKVGKWRLLLQVDSCGEMIWRDCGMIFFCIPAEDLEQGRFDRVWLTLDSP